MAVAAIAADGSGRLQDRLLIGIGSGAFLVLVGYELVAGCRDSKAAEPRSEPGRPHSSHDDQQLLGPTTLLAHP
ncbi:hypothetical protein [Natrinema ejinorense]|uniref:Uncharacterized protein n=1 Tax=Natrinema ejinorense TaxID=373386 RepID=A0A2A5QVI3_9EURY|nr:hypothetical protein [Natrinema ejinorense]PCR90842.1 hypothetical protein CP557_10130 [Natrinema ejinorense]